MPYVLEILKEFKLLNATPVTIPMNPKESWEPTDTNIMLSEIKIYQKAICKLMYLMLASRPDISYAITKLAQYASAPTLRHWNGVLRIMGYLKSHESVRLCLRNNPLPIDNLVPPTNLIGYFDTSLMNCTASRRSKGGYVFFYDGSVISWKSKK